jgi:TRAP-type C4-dicarboxylate transport system permease small subunit
MSGDVSFVLIATVLLWGGYELFALATKRQTISRGIQDSLRTEIGARYACLICIVLGILLGHFFFPLC